MAKLRKALLEFKPHALTAMDECLQHRSHKVRIEALKLWLAYCYGPPPRDESETPGERRAYAFFQPLTEEQVQLAERMVKALPNGDVKHETESKANTDND